MGGRIPRRRHRQGPAGAGVEVGSRPASGDRMVVEAAFRERAAIVRADVVDAKKLAIDAKEHDDSILDLQQRLAGVGKVGRFRDADKIRHQAYSRTRRRIAWPSDSRTLSIV